MDLEQKLAILAPASRFDACDSFSQQGRRYQPRKASWNEGGIVTENGADGRARPIFRLLMSSRCEWNCAYCPLRSGNDTPRATLGPEELAKSFLPRVQRGAVQGLMLSSGVDGGRDLAAERMLDAVEHLRRQHHYRGYVHLKLLPGASATTIERAAQLADRLSLNLEAPTAAYLTRISPERNWEGDVMAPLLWMREWARKLGELARPRHSAGHLGSGLATQFVVGASGESDRDLLLTTMWLYRDLELRRVYFGAFRPVAGTPLHAMPATPFVREQRLREADWLLRNYGFEQQELPYTSTGNLPLHIDPKLAWALAHPEFFPVELNTADESRLLRVPGLGPIAVRRILRLRAEQRFRDVQHLHTLGAAARRASDFVTLDGKYYGRSAEERLRYYNRETVIAEQLPLWE